MQDQVKFDLTIVSHMSYYSGILFEVYAGKVGFPIGNGGRYSLIEKFGKNASATGFAVHLDRLLEALGSDDIENTVTCILFSQERRKEAFQLAEKMHEQGKRTVLQDINGVKNLDAYTKNSRIQPIYLEGVPMNNVLTIAMPKGRIFEEAADLLRKAGYQASARI